MKLAPCQKADSTAIAIPDGAREHLHAMCPGAYITPGGEVRRCGCECHPAITDTALAALALEKVLPVVEEPPAADAPEAAPRGRKKARKRAPGRCEHCGAPTGGRFAVGHDAKLKSELAAAASGGDAEAVAELILRDWWRLTKVPIPPATVQLGSRLAENEGYKLVERRNRSRIEDAVRGGE